MRLFRRRHRKRWKGRWVCSEGDEGKEDKEDDPGVGGVVRSGQVPTGHRFQHNEVKREGQVEW